MDDLQPLGSFKGLNNKPSPLSFVEVDLSELFLSEPNQNNLTQNVFRIHKKHGGCSTLDKFYDVVPRMMNVFEKKIDMDQYKNVDADATGQVNWAEVLKTLNKEFIKYCYKMFKWEETYNPYTAQTLVGPSDNRVQKKNDELLAADYPTMDVWTTRDINVKNSNMRYNNAVPVWRASIHKRHYDKNNDGLVEQSLQRETPIYGYDMQPIQKTIDKWKKSEWFGM